MGDYDIDENMGDSDEVRSTISVDSSKSVIDDMLAIILDSSESETDDRKKDPTFRCKVKKSFQKHS